MVQRMYREVILTNCFTEAVFCGLMFSLWLHHFLTLSMLWKEMEIVDFDTSKHFANC